MLLPAQEEIRLWGNGSVLEQLLLHHCTVPSAMGQLSNHSPKGQPAQTSCGLAAFAGRSSQGKLLGASGQQEGAPLSVDLLESEGAAVEFLGCAEAGFLGRGTTQQEELV